MTFLIAYDLKISRRNYESFFDAVKSVGEVRQALPNVVVARVSNTSTVANTDRLSQHLAQFLTHEDKLMIYDITHRRANGLMTNDAWTWLNASVEG